MMWHASSSVTASTTITPASAVFVHPRPQAAPHRDPRRPPALLPGRPRAGLPASPRHRLLYRPGRHLKPSNLCLRGGRPEDVVLLDFGLARHQERSLALTASQMVPGTPGYMAPEQVSAQSELTPSADLFSLGCVLY